MKKNYPRRNFVRNSFLASGGLVLINPIAGMASSPNREDVTAALSFKSDIRKRLFGKQIKISGQVFDGTGKKPLSRVTLDFWHLSPNSNHIGHRGRVTTDAHGFYEIRSDHPAREKGKATTVYFRPLDFDTAPLTEIKFTRTDAHITDKHWEANNRLTDDLLFPQLEKSFNQTKITFNFIINTKN